MGLVRVGLAMAVLLSHLSIVEFKFLSGGLAVQSFFVISGFYMALVLDGKYKQTSLFYSNRLLRLFPTYFVACALGALALWAFNASPTASPDIFSMYANPLTAAVMAFENVFMIGQEMLFWFTVNADGALVLDTRGALPDETTTLAWQGLLIPQSWSLSMELMFYALAPWLARSGWKWIAAIAALSIGGRLGGHFLDIDYLLWQGRFFPTALFLFLFGVLAHKMLPLAARVPKAVGWAINALLLGFIVFHPMLMQILGIEPMAARWITYALLTLAIPFVFNASKNVALDRWIGDLSYPIYLSQLLVIGLVLTYRPPFAAAIAMGGTILLSALILVLIEHPLDRWANRVSKAPPERSAAPGGVTVAPL